jgi:hypothetical protein
VFETNDELIFTAPSSTSLVHSSVSTSSRGFVRSSKDALKEGRQDCNLLDQKEIAER